jgi:hypothetical protein
VAHNSTTNKKWYRNSVSTYSKDTVSAVQSPTDSSLEQKIVVYCENEVKPTNIVSVSGEFF